MQYFHWCQQQCTGSAPTQQASHVTVSKAYSSPILIPPWNTVAPGLAGVAFANRLHFFSVEGTLPEELDLNTDRRVSASADQEVGEKSRAVLLLLLMGVVDIVVFELKPRCCFKISRTGAISDVGLVYSSSWPRHESALRLAETKSRGTLGVRYPW